MKARVLLMLCAASASVFAQTGALPPVIDNSVYAASGNRGAQASENAIFEVLSRIEQLQAEVQQLRGMVEEQAQTIADLERKQNNIYTDLDQRVESLSSVAQSMQHNQTVAPTTSPESAAPPQPVAQPVVESSAQIKSQEPPPPPPPNEHELYQSAYETLRNGRNNEAIRAFEALLAQFPKGEYADNAQYWLAEAHKINRDIDAARAAFFRVVSNYPTSSKVPDALLKLGYIEFEQNNMAKARDYLTQVTVNYPGTTAAHLASKKLAQFSTP